jgi:hypothetical protein
MEHDPKSRRDDAEAQAAALTRIPRLANSANKRSGGTTSSGARTPVGAAQQPRQLPRFPYIDARGAREVKVGYNDLR